MKTFINSATSLFVAVAMLLQFGGAGLSTALADSKTIQRYTTTLPYTTFDVGLPLVQVRMNNKVTGTFLVDTGFNFSLLTETTAKKLGLTPAPASVDGKALFMDGHPANAVTVDSLQIGWMTLSHTQFAVVRDRRLTSIGPPFDGIIGANLLNLFSVLFNFPKHQITLWYPAGLSDREIKAAGFEGAAAVPVSIPPNDAKYFIPVQLRQGELSVQESMLLDTGGAVTVISKGIAQQLGLNPVGHITQQSFGGSYAVDQARLTALRIGDIEVGNKVIEYPSEDHSQVSPILGMDTLAGYRVLLDLPSKKMYIQTAMPPLKIQQPEAQSQKPVRPASQ